MPPALGWSLPKLCRRPSESGALAAYAAFLERYGDPEARTVYRQLLTQSNQSR